jgi:hypothetical protein
MSIKVLFICGTLEPIKSGVADFIYALATKLSEMGISCACLAIHDPFVTETTLSSVKCNEDYEFRIIRLAAKTSWFARSRLIKDQVCALSPDLISFHYVPFAYHSKGLPIALLIALFPIRHLVKWEITAHELWVDPSFSLPYRALSFLQRFLIIVLCKMLQPVDVHVTNFWYQRQLKSLSIKSSILPLFSNIPYCPLPALSTRPGKIWNFIVFGSVNRDGLPHKLFQQIEIGRRTYGIETCHFVSVGAISPQGAEVWDSLQALPYTKFKFSRLGILSSREVSEQLQLADFGICVTPSIVVDKSASVAAMLGHGLPVIISRLIPGFDEWHQDLVRRGTFILLNSLFIKNIGISKRYPPSKQLDDTAARFICSLRSSIES